MLPQAQQHPLTACWHGSRSMQYCLLADAERRHGWLQANRTHLCSPACRIRHVRVGAQQPHRVHARLLQQALDAGCQLPIVPEVIQDLLLLLLLVISRWSCCVCGRVLLLLLLGFCFLPLLGSSAACRAGCWLLLLLSSGGCLLLSACPAGRLLLLLFCDCLILQQRRGRVSGQPGSEAAVCAYESPQRRLEQLVRRTFLRFAI